MMLRETLTHAAAQAYDRLSTDLACDFWDM